MTEEEWLACTDPSAMLAHVCGKAGTKSQRLLSHLCRVNSERKLRLFACACWRKSSGMSYWSIKRTVELAELYVDGLLDEKSWQRRCEVMHQEVWEFSGADLCSPSSYDAALAAATMLDSAFPSSSEERVARCRLVRDIFGTPFRRVKIPVSWRTMTAVGLAQAIYTNRAFDRMPILADALEDAGCTNVDVLNHCRQSGEHVRGCWVVDLVLGKQ